MSADFSVEQLLRWRSDQAELEAPAPPGAKELLRRTRPWWERMPEEFGECVERLLGAQPSLGYALEDSGSNRAGWAVPVLRTGPEGESVTFVRITYLSIREGRLRLRFVFGDATPAAEVDLGATFVSNSSGAPLMTASAGMERDGEYRVETDLPLRLAEDWGRLRVTDSMPFRLILHADSLEA